MKLIFIVSLWIISAVGMLLGFWHIYFGKKRRRKGERISIRACNRGVYPQYQTGGELIGSGIVAVVSGGVIAVILLMYF